MNIIPHGAGSISRTVHALEFEEILPGNKEMKIHKFSPEITKSGKVH